MIIFLGIIDIIIGLTMLLHNFMPGKLMTFFGVYLLLKGGFFALSKDVASYLDIFVGVCLILLAMNMYWATLITICALFLVQKGLFSLVMM